MAGVAPAPVVPPPIGGGRQGALPATGGCGEGQEEGFAAVLHGKLLMFLTSFSIFNGQPGTMHTLSLKTIIDSDHKLRKEGGRGVPLEIINPGRKYKEISHYTPFYPVFGLGM